MIAAIKQNVIVPVVSLMIILVLTACSQQSGIQSLKGPYLGQKPPGKEAEIFAPGIISTEAYEHGSPVFTKDLKEIYWTVNIEKNDEFITRLNFMMREKNGVWSQPEIPEVFEDFAFCDYPFITPDGNKLFFSASEKYEANRDTTLMRSIYYADRKGNGWDQPVSLEPVVVSQSSSVSGPTVSNKGNLFYSNWDWANTNQRGLFYSTFVNGKYNPPVMMEDMFNQSRSNYTPYISPDESYFIFASWREEGYGWHDLYISFKLPDGTWSEIINMGDSINTEWNERFPNLSPDGRYLFFNRNLNGNGEVYWVDAKVIEDLKPDHLK